MGIALCLQKKSSLPCDLSAALVRYKEGSKEPLVLRVKPYKLDYRPTCLVPRRVAHPYILLREKTETVAQPKRANEASK